jgi:hypothetical protein
MTDPFACAFCDAFECRTLERLAQHVEGIHVRLGEKLSEAQLHPMGLMYCADCPHICGIDDPEHKCRPAHTPPPKRGPKSSTGAATTAALDRPLSAPREKESSRNSHVDNKHSDGTAPKAPAASADRVDRDRASPRGPTVELGQVGATSAFAAPRQQRTRGRPARYQSYVDHDGFEAGGTGGACAAVPGPAAGANTATAATSTRPPPPPSRPRAWTGQPFASRWMAQNAKAADRRSADDALVRQMRPDTTSPSAAAAATSPAPAGSPPDEKGARYAAETAAREAAATRSAVQQPTPMFAAAAAAADRPPRSNASNSDEPALPSSPSALSPDPRSSPIDPSASLPTPSPRTTPDSRLEHKSPPAIAHIAGARAPHPQYSHYPKMWEALPRSCIKPFVAVCRPHFEALHRAIRDNHSGPPGSAADLTAGRLKQALDNVLAIPRACLTRIDGRPPTESLKSQISRFHSRYRADDPHSAVELALAAAAQAQAQRPDGARTGDRTARRVEHRLNSGTRNAASRAASIPFQSGIAAPDANTIARLHELHPAGSGPLPRMPSAPMCPVR